MGKQPEAQLSEKIKHAMTQFAKDRGHKLFIFKVHGSEHQMAGVPDMLACYRGRFVGIETKMPGNHASAIQKHRHKQIREAEGVCRVVYSVEDALEALESIDEHCEGMLDWDEVVSP